MDGGTFIYNFEMAVSLSLEGLLRIFREGRADHLARISEYFGELAEQSEMIAAPWKDIANALQVQLQARSRGAENVSIMPDFCLVEALSNVAGMGGMRVHYRSLSKTLDGHVKQEVLDRIADAIGTVLRDRDAARSAYDELIRQSSSGGSVAPAELRAVIKRVETLLTTAAQLKAIVSSTKVNL
jgi:hypothetical protein